MCATLGATIPVGGPEENVQPEEQVRQKRQFFVPSVAVQTVPYATSYVHPAPVVVAPAPKVAVATGHTESYVFHHSPEATYYIHQRHPHYSHYYYPPTTTHYVTAPVAYW